MAVLPTAGANEAIGIEVVSVADNAGFDSSIAHMEALKANTEALNASTTRLNTTQSTFASTLKSASGTALEVGRTMSTYATLPIVGLGAASVMAANNFQQSMLLIKTQAGDTTDNIGQLSQQVIALSKNTRWSPDELANGLYHLISLGMQGSDAMKALNASQELAAVGNSNLEDTTNAVAVAWKSGIQGAQDFGQAAGSLNAIVGAGNMRMNELVQAMGPTGLLAAAKTVGVSLNDVGAAEALLSDMTGDAQQSATHLRMALMLMSSPSAAAAKALGEIGIKSTDLGVALQKGGIQDALKTIRDHLDKSFGPTATDSLKTYLSILQSQGADAADAFANSSASAAQVVSKAFGGAKSSAVVMQLLSGSGSLAQKETQIGQQSGMLGQDYTDEQQTGAYKLHAAWAKLMADFTQLGTAIAPQVADAIGHISQVIDDLTNKFNGLSSGQKQFVVNAALVIAAIGPVLMIFGTLGKFIGTTITLFGGIADAVVAVVSAIMPVLGTIAGVIGGVIAGIAEVFAIPEELVVLIGLAIAAVVAGLVWVAFHWNETVKFLQNAVGAVGKFFGDVWNGMVKGASDMANSIGRFFTQTIPQAFQAFMGWLGKLPDSLAYAAGRMARMLVDFVTKDIPNFINSVGVWFSKLPGEIGNALTSAWNGFVNWGNNMIGSAGRTVGAIGNWFAQLPGNIVNTINNTINAAARGWQNFYNNATGWISKTVNDIINTFKSIPAHIQDTINQINNTASSIGNNVSSGWNNFWGGIGNSFSQGFNGHATGTNYAPGGWTLVGERGPELMKMPAGAQVKTNTQSRGMGGGGSNTSVTIGTVVLQTPAAAQEFFRQLNQDTMNLGKGLTAIQGSY